MKRFIVLFSAVILCLTLAGCSGSQYKKATELYEQETTRKPERFSQSSAIMRTAQTRQTNASIRRPPP